MLDLKIVNGTVVDGSGRPGVAADLGVKEGRIVAVGAVPEDARETVDATGRIVAPGFIDAHTHYDAQVFWDPKLSPSCFHGVTTIVGGFCGFSIAPLTEKAGPYLQKMLARVEGMPLKTLQDAVPWNWRSFGDYLSRIDGKVGVNAGFFCGHSALRRVVMGERAVGEKATADELAAMKQLLGRSLAEGAMGFSTTVAPTHNDGDGNPVPSRWADYSEIVELSRVCGDYDGTSIELLPDLDFGPGMAELMADASVAAQRAVNWNVVVVTGAEDREARVARQLAVTDFARDRGGEVIALTVPITPEVYLNFHTGFVFDSLPGIWRQIFKWSPAERLERLKDPALRRQMADDAESLPADSMMAPLAKLDRYRVISIRTESNKRHEGRFIGDIAAERGQSPIDVMLDLTIGDGLFTTFAPEIGGYDHAAFELRAKLWKDDRTLIGASDAGAHLDMIDTFAFSTSLLEEGVRKHKVIGLEEAVHKITDRPARYFGLIDRGLLVSGYHADIAVFDAATVGRGPTHYRFDVPGDEFRIYADAIGVDHVFVNGIQIVRDGNHTGALPGTVLRSGTDTRNVPIGAMRDQLEAA